MTIDAVELTQNLSVSVATITSQQMNRKTANQEHLRTETMITFWKQWPEK